MKHAVRYIIASVALWIVAASVAHAFQTSGKALIVIDHATGLVLSEKNPDEPLPPASMSKIMTIYMVFEALTEGRLSLTDKFPVSRKAAAYRGSTMFLKEGERISVEDLIRGVIVLSGNDASAVLAEAMSPDGTEAGFARLMTERGREIGLTNSNFSNSNGWPDPEHRMSVRDLAALSSRLIRKFPDLYRYFGEREFIFDNRAPENRRNRNPLLKLDLGADGLKTGYAQASGYGIVGSALRSNRRVIFAVTGLESSAVRRNEAERIVNWYFFQFADKELFRPGDAVVDVPLWMGEKRKFEATVAERVSALVAASQSGEITAEAVFGKGIEAPVVKGQEIGRLEIRVPGFSQTVVFPLVANETVERGGFRVRVLTALDSLVAKTGLNELVNR